MKKLIALFILLTTLLTASISYAGGYEDFSNRTNVQKILSGDKLYSLDYGVYFIQTCIQSDVYILKYKDNEGNVHYQIIPVGN